MKAVLVHEFGGPDRLRVEVVADPHAGPGQVVVTCHAAGVNPVDTYIRAGMHAVRPPLPYTPGYDGAGVVAEIGEGVSRWSIGDRVFLAGSVSGTYADLVLCEQTHLHPLPDRVSFAQGAAVGIPYATAHRALFEIGHAEPGQVVLVRGASGGVGTAAVQFARAAGCTVIGTAGSPLGLDLAREAGAHHVLAHDAADVAEGIATITDDRGVDVILEMRADINLAHDLTLLARRGRIVVIGSRGRIEIEPRDAMIREAAVLGVFHFSADNGALEQAYRAVHAALESGVANPVVGQELPLAAAPQAHEVVLAPPAYGKIVLTP
jgi:NADPH:quinone reductase